VRLTHPRRWVGVLDRPGHRRRRVFRSDARLQHVVSDIQAARAPPVGSYRHFDGDLRGCRPTAQTRSSFAFFITGAAGRRQHAANVTTCVQLSLGAGSSLHLSC
jgi:hypothetical protein